MATATAPLYFYTLQLKAATENIFNTEIESPLRRNGKRYDKWIAEALRHPERGVLSSCPNPHLEDDDQSGQGFLHANFGILWSTLKGRDAVLSSVTANEGKGHADKEGRGLVDFNACQLQQTDDMVVTAPVESVESPAKRAKVAQGAVVTQHLSTDFQNVPCAASTTKAEFPRNIALKENSLDTTRSKGEKGGTGKLGHQGLIAGAPSPCRAVRLGPMPSGPPKQPPPQMSKPPGRSNIPEALQVRADQNFNRTQERVFPQQVTASETHIAFTSSMTGTANDRINNDGEALFPGCTSLAVPAAFAQCSNVDHGAIEEDSLSPQPAVVSASWQASALFAPPPPSPDNDGLKPDPLGFASVSRSGALHHAQSVSSPANPSASLGKKRASSANAPRRANPLTETPQQPATPITVSQKIMMFETRSTPCLRHPTPPSAASANLQKSKGGLAATAASSSMSKIMPGKAVVDGSSLFTPRPKVLHRSHSEVMQSQPQMAQFSWKSEACGKEKLQASAWNASDQGSRAAPGVCSSLVHALAPGTTLQNQVRAQSCERGELRSMGIEACETVAVGSQRNEVAKPKSSKTAEQEPKGREIREREQDTSTSIKECVRAKVRPLVPEFKPDPVLRLRQIELKPKVAEDNYEISEPEGDSDEDAEKSHDRGSKHIPKWCGSYLEDLEQQSDVDPDTIFSSKVSRCDLDSVFTDTVYREVGKLRPKRLRGSSGDWRKDRLTCLEIKSYKSRMGHLRSWDEERVDNKESASVR